MHVLLTLFLTLWTAVSPNLQAHRVDGPVEFTDLYGSAHEAEAALGCDEWTPYLWLSPTVMLATLAHELAHANDCIDNGEMDASTPIRPTMRPEWVSNYCWNSDAEWYTCSVVRYGNVAPHEARGWPNYPLADVGEGSH